MTLADLLTEPLPDASELRQLCLVMPTALAQRMVNVHAWYGDPRSTVYPAGLSDGRWTAPADVLPECIAPGGRYYAGFSRLDPSRFSGIEVVPMSAVTLADPQPPRLVPESQ